MPILELQALGYRQLDAHSEQLVTRWIHDRLEVAVLPIPDRTTLLELEDRVLRALDPPLNLQGMPASEIRGELSRLRSALGRSA